MEKLIAILQIIGALFCCAVAYIPYYEVRPLSNFDGELSRLQNAIRSSSVPNYKTGVLDSVYYFCHSLYGNGLVASDALLIAAILLALGGWSKLQPSRFGIRSKS